MWFIYRKGFLEYIFKVIVFVYWFRSVKPIHQALVLSEFIKREHPNIYIYIYIYVESSQKSE